MKRLLRLIGKTLGVLAVLGVVAYGVVYALSDRVMGRTYEVPVAALSIPHDEASIAEGRRLATVHGCFSGCHGKQAEGTIYFDKPPIARVVAPNLTDSVRRYSDAELDATIRHGVRPGGRSLLIMPSESFIQLTNEEVGRIIAFLRALPPAAGPGPSVSLGPLGRIGLATGKFKTAAQLIAATVPPPKAVDGGTSQGRDLAWTVCAPCHDTSLRGTSNPDFTSADLHIVSAYSPEAFTQLLRTGVALGGRNLAAMGEWSRNNLSQLNDAEIAALYGYLHSLSGSARN